MEQDREEGEMSEVETMENETEGSMKQDHDTKCTIFYKADKNGVVVKKLDKINASKIEERAKRFGINLNGSRIVTQKQIDELYENSGIESGNERHFRFDALHLSGVCGLTTKDIFEYLRDYKPLSLEWIDDNSCNVVCQDHISVALALLVHSREIISEEIKEMIAAKSSYQWREGMPHPKTDMILMRFATNSYKKYAQKVPERRSKSINDGMDNVHKNPWGDLCQTWGVYDHQEVFQRKLVKNDYEDNYDIDKQSDNEKPYKPIKIKNKKLAKRLGKRNYASNDEVSSDSDLEWKVKSKTPRMRMHADDEETKIKKIAHIEENDEYAPLSIEVLNSRSMFRPRESKILSEKFRSVPKRSAVSGNIQSRLGVKVNPEIEYSSDSSTSDCSDHNVMSRVQRVNRNQNSSVWSRLDVKASNSGVKSDLRQVLTTKKNKPSDLRDRLAKSKKANLRIEIDNS